MKKSYFARKAIGASKRGTVAPSTETDTDPPRFKDVHVHGGIQKRRGLAEMDHGSLVRLLDSEISFFVRAQPTLRSRPWGMVQCYTCGTWKPWGELDCGHYIPRHHFGTRFDLRNVRPQCPQCNSYHEGEHWRFRQLLVEEIGEEEVKALENTASMWGASKHTKDDLIAMIKTWRERNKPLRKMIKEE